MDNKGLLMVLCLSTVAEERLNMALWSAGSVQYYSPAIIAMFGSLS